MEKWSPFHYYNWRAHCRLNSFFSKNLLSGTSGSRNKFSVGSILIIKGAKVFKLGVELETVGGIHLVIALILLVC